MSDFLVDFSAVKPVEPETKGNDAIADALANTTEAVSVKVRKTDLEKAHDELEIAKAGRDESTIPITDGYWAIRNKLNQLHNLQ